MAVLVTGAAGFIGYHAAEALLARGEEVIGIDNLNDYYDTALKEARLQRLSTTPGFRFVKGDIAEPRPSKRRRGRARSTACCTSPPRPASAIACKIRAPMSARTLQATSTSWSSAATSATG